MKSDFLAAVKTRQQAMWASGDFAVVGTTLQIVGELLCEGIDLRAGERMLDVAAGNGNATLAAARRFATVTSTDYVPALLERGRQRAQAEGLDVTFQEADAEALPFPDASFDVVLSTFGVMFTPNQEKAAAELLRVCRPKGKIGLANWTPDGFIGQVFKTLGKYLPPPYGVKSPLVGHGMARRGPLPRRASTIGHRCDRSRSVIDHRSTGWKCSGPTYRPTTKRSRARRERPGRARTRSPGAPPGVRPGSGWTRGAGDAGTTIRR